MYEGGRVICWRLFSAILVMTLSYVFNKQQQIEGDNPIYAPYGNKENLVQQKWSWTCDTPLWSPRWARLTQCAKPHTFAEPSCHSFEIKDWASLRSSTWLHWSGQSTRGRPVQGSLSVNRFLSLFYLSTALTFSYMVLLPKSKLSHHDRPKTSGLWCLKPEVVKWLDNTSRRSSSCFPTRGDIPILLISLW